MTPQEKIAAYVRLRDQKEAIEKRHKEELAPIREWLEKIEVSLFRDLESVGADSMKTEGGTAFFSTRVSVTTADRGAFFDFVRDNGEWDLLEARPSKAAVEAYLETTGELPPGVSRRAEKVVSIHRPNAKR